MEVVGFLALAALVVKIVSVVKAIGKDTNLVLTQVLVWVVGVAVLAAAAQSAAFEGTAIPGFDIVLGDLDGWSLVLAGLILGSTGAFGYDALTRRNTNEPSLLGDDS